MKRLIISMIALAFAAGAFAQTQTVRAFSHRGGRLERDENTAIAFQESWDAGWTGFETDIRMTKDGEYHLMHAQAKWMNLSDGSEVGIVIYSDLSTYKNAPFEAALKGDYKSIKEETLNPLARQFQEAVKAHRKNLDLKTDGIIAGRMFFAADALKVGLIDKVGTADTATEEVRRLSASMQLEQYAAKL